MAPKCHEQTHIARVDLIPWSPSHQTGDDPVRSVKPLGEDRGQDSDVGIERVTEQPPQNTPRKNGEHPVNSMSSPVETSVFLLMNEVVRWNFYYRPDETIT